MDRTCEKHVADWNKDRKEKNREESGDELLKLW